MRAKQTGATTVEFAVLGVVFMLVLFGVIELARALFTVNALTESTRRGVRMAAVCPIDDAAIAQVAVFNASGDSGNSPIVNGLSPDHIVVEYLDRDGATLANPQADFDRIRYVRVRIAGYQHRLLIPFMDLEFTAPALAATLPRESLGVPREGALQAC